MCKHLLTHPNDDISQFCNNCRIIAFRCTGATRGGGECLMREVLINSLMPKRPAFSCSRAFMVHAQPPHEACCESSCEQCYATLQSKNISDIGGDGISINMHGTLQCDSPAAMLHPIQQKRAKARDNNANNGHVTHPAQETPYSDPYATHWHAQRALPSAQNKPFEVNCTILHSVDWLQELREPE